MQSVASLIRSDDYPEEIIPCSGGSRPRPDGLKSQTEVLRAAVKQRSNKTTDTRGYV